MSKSKTNHICKYSKCNLGEHGERKQYYACDYCDRVNSWRSMACCKEHYDLYIKEVLDARSKDKKIKPERTDKTEAEVNELMSKPIEEVKKTSQEEIEELTGEVGIDIESGVDKINENIKNSKRKSNGKK